MSKNFLLNNHIVIIRDAVVPFFIVTSLNELELLLISTL